MNDFWNIAMLFFTLTGFVFWMCMILVLIFWVAHHRSEA